MVRTEIHTEHYTFAFTLSNGKDHRAGAANPLVADVGCPRRRPVRR
jgi:hypothetical protein